jgi:putative two-component system response regulator
MKQHCVIGGRLLSHSPSGILRTAEAIARSHHERWDGSGYPEGLCGEDIPESARLVAVLDAFDALTTDRPYRRALSNEEALHVLQQGRGTQFEPRVLDAFLESFQAMAAIQRECAEGGSGSGP